MVVGGIQCVGVAVVHLVLTGIGLALGVLDGDARAIEPVADGAHHPLFLGGLEDVVILVVVADRVQRRQPAVAQVFIGVLEDVELQLGRHHRLEPHRTGAGDLNFQDRARRNPHRRLAVMFQ